MLGEYSAMKREVYEKKLSGSTAYSVVFLPLWFVINLIGFIMTLSMDSIPTQDGILGLISVLLPFIAFATLFLADISTMIANLAFLAYHIGWSVYVISTCLISQYGFNLGFGIVQGVFAVADTITILLNVFLIAIYIMWVIMFIRHAKFFALKLPQQ